MRPGKTQNQSRKPHHQLLLTVLLAFMAITLQSNYSQPTVISVKLPRLQTTAMSEVTASRVKYYSDCLRLQLMRKVAALRTLRDY
jgi:thiamine transporter ThiT